MNDEQRSHIGGPTGPEQGPPPDIEAGEPDAHRDAVALPAVSLRSSEIFRGGRLVHIHHDGVVYQLRTTKLGKLILTK